MTGRCDRDLMGEAELMDEQGRVVMRFSAVFRVARKSWADVADAVGREFPDRSERNFID